ncbi:MAG: DUF5993 family protein [Rickettsiaceae bacterium]
MAFIISILQIFNMLALLKKHYKASMWLLLINLCVCSLLFYHHISDSLMIEL